jgi:hypothetical protein
MLRADDRLKNDASPLGPIPLVVGVTGHRDLRPEDVTHLESSVSHLLSDLQKSYPNTPLILLSSLAEGADRLAARVALGMNIKIVVLLPFNKEEYKKDFHEPASVEEFESLLAKAVWSSVIPCELGDGQTSASRSQCYAKAGAFIVEHSQILIALWNGKDSKRVGGTTEVVNFRRTGIPRELSSQPVSNLGAPETGLVYQIVTPRKLDSQTTDTPFGIKCLLPQDFNEKEGEAYFKGIYRRLDLFNRDAVAHKVSLSHNLVISESLLFSPLKSSDTSAIRDYVKQQTICTYSFADTLAQHFKSKYDRVVFCLAGILIVLVALFDLYHSYNSLMFMVAYIVAWGVAWVSYAVASLGEWEKKYLDYRALAEALRVQIFWQAAGLEDGVSQHYLIKHRSALDWIRISLLNERIVEILPRARQTVNLNTRIEAVQLCWIEQQSKWYNKRCVEKRSKRNCINSLSVFLLIFSLLTASVIPVLHIVGDLKPWQNIIHNMLLVIAATEGYQRVLALREESDQYEQMAGLFTRGAKCLSRYKDASDHESIMKLIKEIGVEALSENADWVLMHSKRMEPPKG